MNLPNKLTLARFIMTPIFLILMLVEFPHHYLAGLIVFIIASLTDYFDGKIARRDGLITTFGKFLDPLADKLTQFSVIICLVLDHPVLWVIVGLFVVKELFQLIAGIITLRKGKMLKGALISGKVSTAVLFTSLISMIIFPMTEEIIGIITIVDCVVLLIAFADYFRTYYQNTSMIDDLQQ